MQYRKDKHGNDISILGFGCMRFTKNGTKIDFDKAEKELLYAIENGVNYLDTAYIYPGSEVLVGEVLAKNHLRNRVYLATKLPHYMIKSMEGIEKTFQEQLKRLQTDYIDYYLMHMLNDVETWQGLINVGILDWLKKKQETGSIRQIGFSFHGNTDAFLKVFDAFPWDFCQIQYNYIDEFSQAGRKGLLHAAAHNTPVIIMEPLRGGRLVSLLPEEAKEMIAADEKHRTPAALSFRWLWDQPEVTCILSGMNSIEMIEENLTTASFVKINEFDDYDRNLIEQVKTEINRNIKVGCTGCGYCMPCPAGVDIPLAFHSYNLLYTDSKKSVHSEYMRLTAFRHKQCSASQCIKCGKCETHCPQNIPIREHLTAASRELEPLYYKVAKWLVKVLKLY